MGSEMCIRDRQDAFLFTQPSKIFNRSNGQHFLDKDFNLIIDPNGNSEVNDVSVVVDAKYHDGPADYNEEQLARKSRSEAFLNSKGIKVNKNLPCLDSSDQTSLRSRMKIVNRAYALMIIAIKGEGGVSPEQLQKPIEEKSINAFSPKEQSILNTNELSDQEKSYATWRYESLYTLLWALNIFSELKSPNEICDVPAVVSAIIKPSKTDFINSCKLRSKEEILDELDKIYRMNWACVDARIKGEAVGGNINPSVIYERHYALNWLTNYRDQEWDQVSTDT